MLYKNWTKEEKIDWYNYTKRVNESYPDPLGDRKKLLEELKKLLEIKDEDLKEKNV